MDKSRAPAKLRCAVYTRKSTEDGLEQEYNSLDAQYDACAAYILSQRHEGWSLVTDRYDDGGFSGGNMERPGLKRLLVDVQAGRVDVIVLYKIDRLTRSLSDFARIVEVLDKAGASFVSVTQAFNTTTSMGRLMLNVLLSFAQFEREVTGERIRDKIAASKRKGLWMGGPVPLGYDVRDRKLVVNEQEAELVRHIMRRYVALGSVAELVEELAADGRLTKRQVNASGPQRGGVPFRRGTLYHLLGNRIYLGELSHKGAHYPGEHESIVSDALWQEVQAALAERASGPSRRSRAVHPSLLTGLVVDGLGRAMTPTHACKGRRRYRYYVTRPELLDGQPAWRVSAHDLEAIVCDQLCELLCDRGRLHDLGAAIGDARTAGQAFEAADDAAASLRMGSATAKASLLQRLVEHISLGEQAITISIGLSGLQHLLGAELPLMEEPSAPILLTCEAVRVRRGHELRLVIPASNARPTVRIRDDKLVGLLADAHAARELAKANPDLPLARIAADAGRCRTRLARLLALSCLAPDVVVAIVEGRQPTGLTARSLMALDLPIGWPEQRKLLNIA